MKKSYKTGSKKLVILALAMFFSVLAIPKLYAETQLDIDIRETKEIVRQIRAMNSDLDHATKQGKVGGQTTAIYFSELAQRKMKIALLNNALAALNVRIEKVQGLRGLLSKAIVAVAMVGTGAALATYSPPGSAAELSSSALPALHSTATVNVGSVSLPTSIPGDPSESFVPAAGAK